MHRKCAFAQLKISNPINTSDDITPHRGALLSFSVFTPHVVPI